MDDNDSTSGWNDLAKELGAEPTPESFQRQRLDKIPPPTAPENAETHDIPQAKPSDWTGLADTLGIPAESETLPPLTSEAQPSPVTESSASEISKIKTAATETESLASDSSVLDGSDILFEEEPPLEADTISKDTAEEKTLPADESPIISGEKAQSAFDALFLSGAAAAEVCGKISSPDETDAIEETAGDEDSGEVKKSRRPRRRRGRGRNRRNQGDQLEAAEDAVEEGAAAKEAAIDELDSFDSFLSTFPPEQAGTTQDLTEEQPSDDADESDDRKKGQRRRRPRRRRGRGRGASASDTDNPNTPSNDVLEESVDAEASDTFSDTDENIDVAESRTSNRPSHRNIPTWQEAMSVIVDTNMEARKKAPAKKGKTSSPRGRGRGRGGKPRKKS